MADLKDAIEAARLAVAPLEAVRRPQPSNVERFPTIGQHLIDENTPAYAKTEPPEVDPANAGERAAPAQQFSQFSPLKNLLFIVLGYMWEEHGGKLLALAAALVGVGALVAMAAGWVPHFPLG